MNISENLNELVIWINKSLKLLFVNIAIVIILIFFFYFPVGVAGGPVIFLLDLLPLVLVILALYALLIGVKRRAKRNTHVAPLLIAVFFISINIILATIEGFGWYRDMFQRLTIYLIIPILFIPGVFHVLTIYFTTLFLLHKRVSKTVVVVIMLTVTAMMLWYYVLQNISLPPQRSAVVDSNNIDPKTIEENRVPSIVRNGESTEIHLYCTDQYLGDSYKEESSSGRYIAYTSNGLCIFDNEKNEMKYYPTTGKGKGFSFDGFSQDETKVYYSAGFYEPYGYTEEQMKKEAKEFGYGSYKLNLQTGEDELIKAWDM